MPPKRKAEFIKDDDSEEEKLAEKRKKKNDSDSSDDEKKKKNKGKEKKTDDLFEDCVICFVGDKFEKDKDELKGMVTENGGNISRSITSRSTHCVIVPGTKADEIDDAKSNKVPIVTEKWIIKSVAEGKRLDEKGFAPDVGSSSGATSSSSSGGETGSSDTDYIRWFWMADSGWTEYDKKMCEKLEDSFKAKNKKFDVDDQRFIDFENMLQRRKDDPSKRRAVKRGLSHGWKMQAVGSGGQDIVFCFDTTGSMYSCLDTVRTKLRETCERLTSDIPNIRIGVIAIGDYCDSHSTYATEVFDFSSDTKAICNFVRDVKATGGGDAPEAYEKALRDALEMSWDTSHTGALVMIGDAPPHEPSYTDLSINWWDELEKLRNANIKCYSVECNTGVGGGYATPFYEELAKGTGFHIHLTDFNMVTDMFLAVCYREVSHDRFNEFRNEVSSEGRLDTKLAHLFGEMDTPGVISGAATYGGTDPKNQAWYNTALDTGTNRYIYNPGTDKFDPAGGGYKIYTKATKKRKAKRKW